LARVRIRVEHSICGVKRARILKETLRNRKADFSDLVMLLGCGLHNLRIGQRKRPLRKL
jgi:hypothetical protein